MPDIRINTYADKQLDELAGAMLYVGKLHAGLGTLLDVTTDKEDAALIGYLNHLPGEPAAAMVTSLLVANKGVIGRLHEIDRELTKALHILGDRMRADKKAQELASEFDDLMAVSFADEAKRDGLS